MALLPVWNLSILIRETHETKIIVPVPRYVLKFK